MSGDAYLRRKLGEVLRYVRRPVTPIKDTAYDLIGVRWYAAGTHLHATIEGAKLQAPTLWRVQEGDVIYNKMWTSKGAFAVVSEENSALLGTSEYPTFEANSQISPAFLRHAFRQTRFWNLAEAWTSGTTERARLNPRDFLRLSLPLPSPAQQRVIVEVLDALEKAAAATQALVGAISEAKYATMRELLTHGVRRDHAPMKKLDARWVVGRIAEGITDIPSDWELVTLTKIAKLESGHTPSRHIADYWNGDIPWLSLADTDALDALGVSNTSECVTATGIAHSSARILPTDTVVFSRTATVGKAARLLVPMATSQDFANWVCGPKILPAYLVQVFRHMAREWLRLQEGSTHQTIYMPVFKRLQILLPSMTEQRKIAEVGEGFDRRIELEREAHRILIRSRSALAQELLSGRIRLPESAIARHCDKPSQAA